MFGCSPGLSALSAAMNSSHERNVVRRLNGSAMADADSKIIAMKSFAVTEMRVSRLTRRGRRLERLVAWLRQQLIKRQSVAKRIPELKISNGFWNSFNLVNIDTEARSKHPTFFDVVILEAHYWLIWLIDFTFKE